MTIDLVIKSIKYETLHMKSFNKNIILTAALIASTYTALIWAATDTNNNYQFVAVKNCKVVMQKEMNSEQREAYLAFKQQEHKMHELELPIQDIEIEIQQYSDQIESLVKLAIVDNEDSLYIDKSLLSKHEDIANEFSEFMSEYQTSFDALGEHGQVIVQYAETFETFETTIEADLENVEYDHIEIISPNDSTINSCYNNTLEALM